MNPHGALTATQVRHASLNQDYLFVLLFFPTVVFGSQTADCPTRCFSQIRKLGWVAIFT
jgi:hypothetical protein